jgi:hypothetical protein
MHSTAAQLEVAEAILHRSAEASPSPATTTRLHALGDEVTAQAKAIDRRAGLLSEHGDPPDATGEPDDRAPRVATGKSVAFRPAE